MSIHVGQVVKVKIGAYKRGTKDTREMWFGVVSDVGISTITVRGPKGRHSLRIGVDSIRPATKLEIANAKAIYGRVA